MVIRKIRPVYKNCYFCENDKEPDYKEPEILGKFISERGKMIGRVRSGICSTHQRKFSRAVKHARYIALLPFVIHV